jgi:hypothetical protein
MAGAETTVAFRNRGAFASNFRVVCKTLQALTRQFCKLFVAVPMQTSCPTHLSAAVTLAQTLEEGIPWDTAKFTRLEGRSRRLLAGCARASTGSSPDQGAERPRAPLYEWFTDATVNTCWNAVDRHVEAGRGKQAGDHPRQPGDPSKHGHHLCELQARVASLAGALRAKGVEKGDRVIIYMPMVPEALEAMLACARLGAIHSVVFGGFAANELAVGSTTARRRRSSRPLAGSSRTAWCITSRCWMPPSTWPTTSPTSA